MWPIRERRLEESRHTFALLKLHGHDTSDHAAKITTVHNVAIAEAETNHKLVEDRGGIFARPFAFQWWTSRESVSWKRGHDNVVGQLFCCVFAGEKFQNLVEFEEAACVCVRFRRHGPELMFTGEEQNIPGQPCSNMMGIASSCLEKRPVK